MSIFRRLLNRGAALGGVGHVSLVWGLQLLVILGLILGAVQLDRLNFNVHLDRVRNDVEQQLNQVRTNLETHIQINIQTVRGLVATIATEPDMQQERFSDLARYVLASRSQIRNVSAAPDMVISMVYPIEGNEAALGLDYRTNAEQWPEVLRAAETGQLVLAGPIELVQGGRAFIGRIPVLIQSGEPVQEHLWGLVSTAINVEQLYQMTGLLDDSELSIAIAKASDKLPAVFFGEATTLDHSPVKLLVQVPGGEWLLAAYPKSGWPVMAENVYLFRSGLLLLGLLLVVPTLLLTWSIQRERSSQLRLQGLFELSPLGIALLDQQAQHFLQVNPAMKKMLGYEPGEQLLCPWRDVLPGAMTGFDLTFSSDQVQHFAHEGVAITRDDRCLPVRMTFSHLRQEDGRALFWLMLEDLTDSKRVERLKSEFVSTVSHELRTPLTSISGSLALVARGALGQVPDKLQPVLDIALENSHRLTRLINDLLDMEKLLAGKVRYEMAPHDLIAILRQSIEACQGYAENFEVELKLDAGDLRPWVLVDQARMQQVLLNLISNAIKFSKAGGRVMLLVTVDGDIARIAVSDQGSGVPESFRARLFEPFAQADSSDSRYKEGTGLGLAISRGLVERMGGAIGLAPKIEGQGATFYIELPVVRPDGLLSVEEYQHVTT